MSDRARGQSVVEAAWVAADNCLGALDRVGGTEARMLHLATSAVTAEIRALTHAVLALAAPTVPVRREWSEQEWDDMLKRGLAPWLAAEDVERIRGEIRERREQRERAG